MFLIFHGGLTPQILPPQKIQSRNWVIINFLYPVNRKKKRTDYRKAEMASDVEAVGEEKTEQL